VTEINYLFPPEEVENLPTWRFVLHFVVTEKYKESVRKNVIAKLKAAEWKIIEFPYGLDNLELVETGEALSVPIEVPEDRRRGKNSLEDYESDVWKVIGNVLGPAFSDIYYEAVDWEDDDWDETDEEEASDREE
jgi:hypothetical protein